MSLFSVASEPNLHSPVDSMGEVISQRHNVMFNPQSKEEYDPLSARIISQCTDFPFDACILLNPRIGLYYINAYGHEIHPSPNPDYLSNLSSNDVLVYSCGSLWTRCHVWYYFLADCLIFLLVSFPVCPCEALPQPLRVHDHFVLKYYFVCLRISCILSSTQSLKSTPRMTERLTVTPLSTI